MRRIYLIALVAGLTVLASLQAPAPATGSETHWWRGNTHTHSLWSDGDGAPEWITDWYVKADYDFLMLSDHNILSQGERWFAITENGRLTPARVEVLVELFGSDAVEVRETDKGREMRLKTLADLRKQFESPGEFLLIQGEEVTDSFEGKPVHINGVNLDELIEPQGGTSVRDTMNRNVDAIAAQGERLGQPTLAHINHPNFGWGLTWQDVAAVTGDNFFEVYNGHTGVRNQGDPEHVSTEELWDRALTLRLTELELGLLYGVATDDAHNYWKWGAKAHNPGRGWVVVRSEKLEADAIVAAMQRGDFYASSGVELDDIQFDGKSYTIDIRGAEGVTYTTRFIGTRNADEPGALLASTDENPAVYELRGDELYVRAVVTSSQDHSNPYAAGDKQTAWVQPVRP